MNTLQAIFNFIKNNPGSLVTLIIIGAPILSAILKAMAQKKQQRDAQLARERAELESLRTGRPVEAAQAQQVSARERLEELAQRRRQAVAGAPSPPPMPTPAAQTPPSAGGQTRLIRLPGGIVLEVPAELTGEAPSQPAPAQTSPPPQRPRTPKRRPSPAPTAQGRMEQPTAKRAKAKPERSATSDEDDPSATARRAALVAATKSEAAAVSAAVSEATATAARRATARDAVVLGPISRSDWRRAMVLREVLGPPVGMR